MHPLHPKAKQPATKHGLLDATTDLDIVIDWWHRQPHCNIGLRTGIVHDVLDLDGPEGRASMLETAGSYRHDGPVASTGKGNHLLFATTGTRNFANKLPGFDFRGRNGYIVAAPSIHPDGHRYQWLRGTLTDTLPEAPPWLSALLTPDAPKARQRTNEEALAYNSVHAIVDAFYGLGCSPRLIGSNFLVQCPFGLHTDSDPSCWLYPATNSFFCFGCRSWGDAIDVEAFKRGTLPPRAQ